MPADWQAAFDAARAPCPPERLETLKDRAVAAFLGVAIGDALGATVEFLTPREVQAQYGIHKDIVGGGWLHLKPGRVTDDTDMSLALGRAILDHGGRVSARAAAEAFSAWMSKKPVDIGHTVRRGISAYRRSGTPFVPDNPMNAGNGGIMRVLPVALATLGAPWAEVVRAARLQAHVTHTCALADAGMEIAVALVQTALTAPQTDLAALAALAERATAAWPDLAPAGKPEAGPTAFVGHTLRAVFQALGNAANLETGLLDVVNRGGDADTTGAILGMILGAACGTAALPKRWTKKLDPTTARACADQASAVIAFSPTASGLGGPVTG